ncbi:MAG TPA: hypothetical protein VGD89_05600 [Flavipsychrobacter sp.]
MMLKTIFPTALLALCSLTTHAQRDARVQLQLGNWGSSKSSSGFVLFRTPANVAGVTAEHRIYKNLYVKAGYQRWISVSKFDTNPKHLSYSINEYDAANLGAISFRSDYSMVDVLATYRLPLGRHELYASGGISTAFGKDYILTHTAGDGSFGDWGCIVFTEYEEIKAHHIGATWEAGYNYNFAHQRLNIGTSISGQHYASDFNLYTIKLNLGYNFNILNRK